MKPKAPRDLWAQMDELRQQCSLIEPPENSFTVSEYGERYGLSPAKSGKDIKALLKLGKVRKVENCRRPCYVVVTP